MKLDQLQQLLHRLMLVVVGFAAVATVATISATVAVFKAQAALERTANERPVMVVPGAVAGEYVAGLSEDNLRGLGRYMAQLATSFTSANFRDRMQELKYFADASYLPVLTNNVQSLETEIAAQSQGRFFIPDLGSETLVVLGPNLFEYRASGPWTFSAAGLALSEDRANVSVRFYLGRPSEKNRYGLQLKQLEAVRSKGKV